MGTLIAVLLSVLFVLISYSTALQKSLTFDEPMHLYAGYSHLQWGDFRVNPEHPPLAKMLAALPLLALNVNAGGITQRQRDFVQTNKLYGWDLADQFILANRHIPGLTVYPKLVMIGLTVVLGLLVFHWARKLYGLPGGTAALALYFFDPNITAHSSIIHTDIPFALFFFMGTYFFWHASQRLTWLSLLGTALFFALAAITKYSFASILPAWGLLGIILAFASRPQQSEITSPAIVIEPWRKIVLLMVTLGTALIVAYVAIWSVYGFRFDAVQGESGQLRIGRLVPKESWLSVVVLLNAKHFLVPEAWLYGFLDAVRHFDRPSYLLGEVSNRGSWLFFPVAFVVKTPLPALVMMVLATALLLRRRKMSLNETFLLVPALAFFCVAAGSKLNIGWRHILPVYPFLFVWLGGAAAALWRAKTRSGRCAVAFLGVWLAVNWVRSYPDYLAYFNELAGGPANGSRLLVDSNLDWGQDLPGLKRWMDEHKVKMLELAYFGTANPAAYGINAVPLPGSLVFSRWPVDQAAAPVDHVAISATYLAGLYVPQDIYASYRNKAPLASIGYSILVFRKD